MLHGTELARDTAWLGLGGLDRTCPSIIGGLLCALPSIMCALEMGLAGRHALGAPITNVGVGMCQILYKVEEDYR